MKIKIKQKNCPVCNKTFLDESRGKVKKYCSKECFKQHVRNYKRKKYYESAPSKNCPVCNKKYHTRKNLLFCSKECKLKVQALKEKKREKKCVICNKTFIHHKFRPGQKYCSKKCNDVRTRKQPAFKIRSNVYESLRRFNVTKIDKFYSLLGCTIKEFKQHIESQFSEGMSWDNHGEWHIDHIKPISSFDLTQEAEQKKAFHYLNVQPLWAIDNMRKGSKW